MEWAHRRVHIREVDIACLNWSLSLRLIKHRYRACCRFLLSFNMTDTGTNPPQYQELINTNRVWEMSAQLRIILQYATESCSSSLKKRSYNFMNLWQVNREGCSSLRVAQWTFCVSGCQGRCSVCEGVSVHVCFREITEPHRQTWTDTLEN